MNCTPRTGHIAVEMVGHKGMTDTLCGLQMFDLWKQIFAAPNFDEKNHLHTMIAMDAAEYASSISHAGHTFAGTRVYVICGLLSRYPGVCDLWVVELVPGYIFLSRYPGVFCVCV